jgi:hypothetical protein
MASKLLAPVLAVLIAISGFVRWEMPAAADSGNRPTVLAGKQGCPWNCASAPVIRGRELARRPCGGGQGQFLASSSVAFNRLPSVVAVSSLCSTRTASRFLTLHDLRVKLQV